MKAMDTGKMMDLLKELAKGVMEELGTVENALVVFERENQVRFEVLPLAGPEYKALIESYCVHLAHDPDVIALGNICEAWMVKSEHDVSGMTDAEFRKEIKKLGRASQHPDRIEVVVVSLSTVKGTRVATAPKISNGRRKPTLGDWTDADAGAEGRYANYWRKAAVLQGRAN